MKRSVLLLAVMMVSAVGFSQSTLKGPKAKNAKATERYANAKPMKFYTVPDDTKGPVAKNQKVWNKEEGATQTVFVRRKEALKGPKAKNRKVWED
ncbi:hypothetical protein SAMN04489724_3266 [Algoriphagus locisalis]|uniref:Uncharacterized protein n=1 Tax=Algoriphagus locisalis TaxID=305507 RepID=A0A1I7CJL1_9BACT|nr:hypothetical protein [Algoriphagus locisalis]SFT99630.1 hypothetical protein SAMN04489724_3266 [Algoriphagus locisalis]